MSLIPDRKLDFWIKNNYNVLFIGEHGVGKTSIIEEAFNRHNVRWRYFSASTMDPWVDLIGVPKEQRTDDGRMYLELVRPLEFQIEPIEFFVFDEFNRAPPKVRNAVMELIQFGSINSHKFQHLRGVWAAINPYDEEETYNVEELDPAQEDRFHIQYQLPYMPDKQYFVNKYGEHLGLRAIDWWNFLPDEHKKLVSPRRLDYTLDVYTKGGDITDVLCKTVRPKSLKTTLERVSEDLTHNDRWLSDPDQYINEIAARGSKVDVVEALTELKEISVDQAVGYVHHLTPSQLGSLAKDPRTAGILVRAATVSDSDPRKIKTALAKTKAPVDSMNDAIHEFLRDCTTVDSPLSGAITKCGGKERSSTSEWQSLCAMVEHRATEQELTYGQCMLLMALCCDRVESTVSSGSRIRGPRGYGGNPLFNTVGKIISLVLNYAETNLDHDAFLNVLRVDPVTAVQTIRLCNGAD